MELITRHICKGQDLGVHGNLFGGDMLKWLDEAGAMFARMKANSGSMVTLYMGDHVFKKPVKRDEQVEIFGKVLKRGNTSIKIKLVAEKIVLNTGRRVVVTETQMVFVRINKNGEPRPINWPESIKLNKEAEEASNKNKPVKFKLDIPDNSGEIPKPPKGDVIKEGGYPKRPSKEAHMYRDGAGIVNKKEE